MAVTTSLVTGEADEVKQVLAADGSRTEVYGVNQSGVEIEIFLDSQTVPLDVVSGKEPNNRFGLTSTSAVYKVAARCRTGKLAVTVSAFS